MARRTKSYFAKSNRGKAGAVFVNNVIANSQKRKKQEAKAAEAASRRRAREAERERARRAKEEERKRKDQSKIRPRVHQKIQNYYEISMLLNLKGNKEKLCLDLNHLSISIRNTGLNSLFPNHLKNYNLSKQRIAVEEFQVIYCRKDFFLLTHSYQIL